MPSENPRSRNSPDSHQEKSELQNMLKKLKKSEKIYRELFEKAPIGIFRTSSSGKLLFANASMASILGFPSVQELMTHYPALASEQYLHSEGRQAFLHLLQEKRAVENFEYETKTLDGRPLWLRMNARILEDETGNTFCIEGFTTDITAQKKTEKALFHQSRLQQLLMEIASRCINLPLEEMDTVIQQSMEDMACFVDADRAYIFTYDFQKQICTNTHEWCRKGIAAQIDHLQAVPFSAMEDWIEAHTEGRRVYIPDVSTLPCGGVRDVLEPQNIRSLLTVPMMHKAACLGFIGFDSVRYQHTYSDTEQQLLTLFAQMLVNVSLRKEGEEAQQKLQAQLMQAQKMESVGRLAGGVAHDFNNMLSVIIGHAELALEDLGADHPIAMDLQQIHQAAQRSADLTRQLLAFARKQTAMPRILDLNQTIGGMLKMLQRLIGEDILLSWLPGEALWPVMLDPGQIDQILANLCINARDAIEGTGEIRIRTQMGSYGTEYTRDHKGFIPGDYLVFSVEDTGHGMDAEVMSRLFEPFFTTKALGKGTGLGLATVYGIVKQNGGYIHAESIRGQGSRFTVYLPRHQSPLPEAPQDSQETVSGKAHETILVAEDEPAILQMAKRMLENLGYGVLGASSPEAALHLAHTHAGKLHLLITDVIMPGMNGKDLAHAVTALHPDIKKLFTSGYTADVIDRHGVLNPGVHFIQKPFSRKALSQKVREALDAP